MKVPAAALALPSLLRTAAGILYVRSEAYMGQDFFEPYRWSFYDGPDPTHGTVDYVNYTTAANTGLINASADRVYMGADRTSVDAGKGGRKSVRIESVAEYNRGLFIITLDHIPTGCGAWPAFWLFGQDAEHVWPHWGELDIIEGVHLSNETMTTLHTTVGCDQRDVQPGVHFSTEWKSGLSKEADNCDIKAEGQWSNQGCSQKGPPNSMGPAFNAQGGGTFASEWDPQGGHVRTWFWPASTELPGDITMHAPDPDSWGRPYSFFRISPESCPEEHFRNMKMIFDLTFCGDLGSPTFAAQCPELAKTMTCQEYVERHPDAMKEAYWSIRALDVYQVASVSVDGELSVVGTGVEATMTPAYNVLELFRSRHRPLASSQRTLAVACLSAVTLAVPAALMLAALRRVWPSGQWRRRGGDDVARHARLPVLAPEDDHPRGAIDVPSAATETV